MSRALLAQSPRQRARPLSWVVRRMLTGSAVFWLVMFAMSTITSLLNDFNVPVHPDAPGRLQILVTIAALNAIFSALLAGAYLFGARLSRRTPTILYTVISGVVLSLLLRLLANVMLAVGISPEAINPIGLGAGLVVALLMPLAAPLIRAVTPNKRIERTREG